MLGSAVELLASDSELHCTGLHICQLVLLGFANYIAFVDRICSVCAILHCICHFPFLFTLLRIFRRLQVIIVPTPGNVKCRTTGQQ